MDWLFVCCVSLYVCVSLFIKCLSHLPPSPPPPLTPTPTPPPPPRTPPPPPPSTVIVSRLAGLRLEGRRGG